MDITTLEKANELIKKIKELQQALNCFEWDQEYGGGTTNPRLIIEFDGGDGRETQPLRINLNDATLSFLRAGIIKDRDAAVDEFNEL